ncbi:MAG: hypothetical protein ACREIT_05230, partial [Tepidisphaeraceae bacterium]
MTLLPIAGRYAILLATSLALGAGGCGARRDGLARGRAVALEPGEERLTTEPRGDGVVGKRGGADASGSPLTALASAPDDPVVARIAGRDITMAELQVPLIEAYGLNVLLNLVQLELAQEHAARVGASVTSQDIEEERRITIARMFQGQKADPEDYDQLLDQFLQKQHISRPEFDLVVQTNAQLRKIAEPQISGKITDAQIEEAFRALYGENVKVRHIQVSNLTEIAEAKRRLGEGQSFEEVARALSRNTRTGALGGELPAFSHMTPGLPDSFKT